MVNWLLLTFTVAVRSVFGEPKTGSAATSNQAAIPVAQLGAAPVPVLTEVPHWRTQTQPTQQTQQTQQTTVKQAMLWSRLMRTTNRLDSVQSRWWRDHLKNNTQTVLKPRKRNLDLVTVSRPASGISLLFPTQKSITAAVWSNLLTASETRAAVFWLTLTVSPVSLQLVVLPTFTLVVIVAHVYTFMLTSAVQHGAGVHSWGGHTQKNTEPWLRCRNMHN